MSDQVDGATLRAEPDSRSWRRWRPLVLALAGGLAGGVALTVGFYRGSPAAYVDPHADVTLTGADGRPLAMRRDGSLRRGEHVRARQRPVDVKVAGNAATVTLSPASELVAQLGAAVARLERGVSTVDATASVTELRVDTPAGPVTLRSARVEIRAGFDLPGERPAPAAVVTVAEGRVDLQSPTGSLTLEQAERGVMVLGRSPARLPPAAAPLAFAPPTEPPEDDPLPPEVLVAAVPVAVAVPFAGASITGVVEMEGAPPDGARSPACAGTGAPAWAVDHGRLANVYVHITSPLPADGASAAPPIEIAQRGCAFAPRVAAVVVGQRVAFGAGDGIGHEPRVALGADVLLDARLLPGAAPVGWTAAREGIFTLRCGLHPEATGTLAVSPHPFFAVSGSDGTFVISGVPPGRHTVTAWHERGGERTTEVTVGTGQPGEVRFRFGEPILASAGIAAAVEPPPPAPLVAPPAPAPEPAVAPPEPDPRPGIRACKLALTGDSPVARACAAGGIRDASAVMKQVVRDARGRGLRIRCEGCHIDTTSHELLAGAREQLQRLLAPPIDYYVVGVRPTPAATPAHRTAPARR